MNFLKGFVDGFLATDSEGNALKTRHSYDPDEQDNDSEGHSISDLSQNHSFSKNNVYINNSISQLSDLYKNERDNCLNGLVVRYGEGCVQQLSELLKSNYDTILSLSHHYQNNLLAFKELNNKMESAAAEQLKLKNENNNLFQQLNLLTTENFNLKSQLTHANITIKSNENHISSLNEIEDLKKKLSLSESHISMLEKERDEFWSDPNRVLTDEDYKKRLSQALERQDRAIAVAKVMASQTPNHLKPEKDDLNDLNDKRVENETLNELKLQVDRLEDENSHLKEINDRLHNMYADLNNNLKEVKNSYLRESVESLTSLFPTKTTPVQLVFIQPTGVLDLDFDPSTLNNYSQVPQTPQTSQTFQTISQTHLQQPQHTHPQPVLQTEQQRSQLHQPLSQSHLHQTQRSLHSHTQTSSHGLNLDKKDENKKTSPKMNLRSKVIQYVTGLDGSPMSFKFNKERNLVDLDSTKRDESNYNYLQEKELRKDLVGTKEQLEKVVKSTSWNADWDMFDEVEGIEKYQDKEKENKEKDCMKEVYEEEKDKETAKQNKEQQPKVEKTTPMALPTDDSFDLILEEENRLSQENLKNTDEITHTEYTHSYLQTQHTHPQIVLQTEQQRSQLHQPHQESNKTGISEFSDFNTHDHFDGYEYDDLLKSIKGEQVDLMKNKENREHEEMDNKEDLLEDKETTNKTEEKTNKEKEKKGWDMDFDDEMFESDT